MTFMRATFGSGTVGQVVRCRTRRRPRLSRKGGVFYTPESIVKLIVEIIEPFHGRILDPACGSGGMFVHSAEFVERHDKTVNDEISIYGVEKDRVRAIP